MAKQRIDKIFSQLGLLSRTDCKKAVKGGLISVNDVLCKSSDEKADPDVDVIKLKGEIVDTRSFVYYMLNKPEGCITAGEDKTAVTVMDYIDDPRVDLNPVGRLDKDTTGILLITNDGDINHRLLSPKNHVPKTYRALINGPLTDEAICKLEKGIDIGDDKPTSPAKCKRISDREFELTITEGRFHQVKRMFEAVERTVLKLHRESFGPLVLDENLKPGEYRELTKDELEQLNIVRRTK